MNQLLRSRIARWLLIAFYVLAGINHFINPDFYLPLIPPYFENIVLVNVLAGVVEIGLGLLVIPAKTRKWGVLGIIALLIAFIPSHVYFIQIGGCVEAGLCVPAWVAWIRLLVIHPMLMYWAWQTKGALLAAS